MKFEKAVFLIAVAWYGIVAYFSTGFYHGDEHFQIIEFAEYFNGNNEAHALTWEFHESIRPATQPVIAGLIFRCCEFFGMTNPFDKAFVLRLLTGIMAVFILRFFIDSCNRIIKPEYKKAFILISYFLWFLPFINVRFSSETWAGLMFLLGTAVLLRRPLHLKQFLFVGVLFGLSFIFRLQMIFAIAGASLWLIIIRGMKPSQFLFSFIAFGIVVTCGVIIDSWFYGKLVFTQWNYVDVNLIRGVAAAFGTSPWYQYFYTIFRFTFFPFGILILLSLLLNAIRKPYSLFIWIIVPFLVGHSFIAHKELRFVFPLINFIPILLILAYQEVHPFLAKSRVIIIRNAFVILLVLLNGVALIISGLLPAGNGEARITEVINAEIEKNGKVQLVHYNNSNPFNPWGAELKFYHSPESRSNLTIGSVDDTFMLQEENILFVVRKEDLENVEVQSFIMKHDLRHSTQSIPSIFIPFLRIYGSKTDKMYILFQNKGF